MLLSQLGSVEPPASRLSLWANITDRPPREVGFHQPCLPTSPSDAWGVRAGGGSPTAATTAWLAYARSTRNRHVTNGAVLATQRLLPGLAMCREPGRPGSPPAIPQAGCLVTVADLHLVSSSVSRTISIPGPPLNSPLPPEVRSSRRLTISTGKRASKTSSAIRGLSPWYRDMTGPNPFRRRCWHRDRHVIGTASATTRRAHLAHSDA